MQWVTLYTRFDEHRKTVELDANAIALWTLCLPGATPRRPFTKLGISSRSQLARVMADGAAAVSAGRRRAGGRVAQPGQDRPAVDG
jgi:hypothetical protein